MFKCIYKRGKKINNKRLLTVAKEEEEKSDRVCLSVRVFSNARRRIPRWWIRVIHEQRSKTRRMLSSHARGDANERLVNTIHPARAQIFFFLLGGKKEKPREKSLSLSLARARDVTINQNDNNNSQTKKKKNNARRVSMQCLPLVPPSGCSRSRNTPSSPSKYPPAFLLSLLVCCVCLENWRHEKGRESFLLYNRDWNPKHKSSRKKNNTNHKKQKTEQKTLSFYNNDERKQHKSWIYWIGNDGRGFGRRPLQRRNCSVVEHLLHGPVATAFGFVPIVRRDGV